MKISIEEFKNRFPKICHDDDCIKQLLSVCEPKSFSKGEQLIVQGQPSDTVYLVWSGELSIDLDSEGTKINLGVCKPGHWIGELGFIEPDLSAANIIAIEDTTVLPITQNDLNTLLETSPVTVSTLMQAFSLNLAERLRETRHHILNKISEDEYSLDEKPESPDEGWFGKVAHKIMGYYGEEQ